MTFKLNNVHKAVNWNVEDDDFTQAFRHKTSQQRNTIDDEFDR